MAAFDKKHKTVLYSVGIEMVETETEDRPIIYVDLQGVRYSDVEVFVKQVLTVPEYKVVHYRVAERYIVLSPSDAHRLAERLNEEPREGRGRLARKSYLVREREIPITVRKRTRVSATLNLYRVKRGATWVYKLEVALKGRTRDRRHFLPDDISRLDQLLLGLVEEHCLKPLAKPARWEPRDRRSTVERGNFDSDLRALGQKAHTGYVVSEAVVRTVAKCHTPKLVGLAFSPAATDAYPPPARLRSSQHSSVGVVVGVVDRRLLVATGKSTTPFEPTTYSREHLEIESTDPKPTNGYEALAREVSILPGCLVEVILPPDDDPVRVIEALAQHNRISVSSMCLVDSTGQAHTWGSVTQLMSGHPLHEDREVDVHVVVIDPTAVLDVEDAFAVWDEEAMELHPGPLGRGSGSYEPDPWAVRAKAMAGRLWPTMKEFRDVCEGTDQKIVVITVDNRPDHGLGPLRPRHRISDARFRSHIGDAGRYWSHQRYRLEGSWRRPRVNVIKDQAEGLTGRTLWPMTG
jgi:hypothetical protein